MNKYNNFQNYVQKDNDGNYFFTCPLEYKKADIIRILSENDDEKKIVAIINLKSIDNKNEANLLLLNLTGQNGRIREAAAIILAEIGRGEFYTDEKSKQALLQALLDINPNVARNIIEFISKSEILKSELAPLIILKTKEILKTLEKFTKTHYVKNSNSNRKNHAKNKLTFNLYWLLSAISVLDGFYDVEILTKTACFLDYTIREKTALILSKMDNPPPELLRKLKNDENIYVKNQLL